MIDKIIRYNKNDLKTSPCVCVEDDTTLGLCLCSNYNTHNDFLPYAIVNDNCINFAPSFICSGSDFDRMLVSYECEEFIPVFELCLSSIFYLLSL